MMLNHLGQHPLLYGFPQESYIIPVFLRTVGKYGDLTDDRNFLKLWADIAASFVFRIRNKGQPLDVPDDWRDVERSVAGIFDWIMKSFAAEQGKRRWAEKTPMHVLHIQSLGAAFPRSRFIHMIRDGRDCAASDHRRWGRNAAGTIYRWRNAVREGRRQGATLNDRDIEFHYEDVTAEPERFLRAACDFAHLQFDQKVLAVADVRKHMSGQESKTIVHNKQRNRNYFSESAIRSLERIAGSCLTDYGYETRFANGDKDPSSLRRAYWTVHDGLRVSLRHLKEKLTTQKRMSWSLLARRWAMIVKSKIANR
jgi:hypothetical protein